MAKYFAGTRSLMSLRSIGSVTWTTTAGRFDPLYVPGAVLVGGENARVDVPIGLDAASVTTLWGHFESFTADVGFFNADNSSFLQFINPSGTIIARFEMDVNPEVLRFQFWNGSVFVTAGPFVIPSIGIRDVFDFRIVCGATGSFQLWRNGSIALSVTGLSAAVDRIAAVGLGSFPRDAIAYSQVALSDFDMRAWKFPSDILTTAGTYNEGIGPLGNMVDLDLSTSYILPTNGTRVTGTSAARALPSGLGVRSVNINGTMRVSSPIANARQILRIGSTDFQSPNITPAPTPGYEIRGFYWDNNPATSSVWSISDYNSAQKGHVAIT